MRTLASNSGPFRITGMVGSSNPITILMVEDSEEDIELTLRGLERAKLQNRIWTVRDGVEALAFLRREAPYEAAPRPDLLLLDLNLPKLDGRDVLLRIRERSEEHTSELQSRLHLVCRLLLEKKKKREHDRPCGGPQSDAAR